jgi:hypothetical protein
LKTPNRITLEEVNRMRDLWVKEFLGDEALILQPVACRQHFCRKCGSMIMQKLAYISIHVTEFETCSGPGHVERLPIPFCPHCEPEPETYGCLHIPIHRDVMSRSFNLRIQ